jgi:5-methylcytosine-specific restriction endonuclease McrA
VKHFTISELTPYRFPWFSRMEIDLWIRLKQFVYERDGGLCQYCKQQTEYKDTHCHHTLELSEGGTNHPTNLKTLCIPCHKSRHPFMKSAKERFEETT